jgi:FKBP-type peptidyl-prolyl cis-trans isomerase FkpA
MIKYSYALIGLLLLAVACKNEEKETPSGLKFTVLAKGDGALPKKGEVIVFHYLLKDSKDSVWSDTFKEEIPAASMIGDSAQIKDEDSMTQMFRMLSKGDSVRTTMTVVEFFKKLVKAPSVPPQVDSTLSVSYTVKVSDITSEDEYRKRMEEYQKKREAKTFATDTESINAYVAGKSITTQKDTSGLQYIIYNSGGKQKPTVDNCVEVKYTGRFLKTGEIFDKNDKIAFPLNGVIAGWKLGIPLLGIGDSGTFYIPSKLAYGPQGYPGAIPPDAILIFDVKLLSVNKEFDQTTRSCK